MSGQKPGLYLVHQETGQRYPLRGEVLIGRTFGEIVFAHDTKLSARHCTILPSELGVLVKDLGSANGTRLNSHPLAPERGTVIKPGDVLELGHQHLGLEIVSLSTKIKQRSKKRKHKAADSANSLYMMSFVILAIAVAVFYKEETISRLMRPKSKTLASLESPMQIVERDLQSAIESYKQMGEMVQNKSLADRQLAEALHSRLVPQLEAVKIKLAVLRPQNEIEKKTLNINIQLIGAMVEQMKTMALFAATKDPKVEVTLEKWSATVEKLGAEKKQLSRQPAEANLHH